MGWVDGPMLGFDTECTGVDVETDHILSASFVWVSPMVGDKLGRSRRESHTCWIDPGVPIPPGATAIHGITDEFIRLNGGVPARVLDEVVSIIEVSLVAGTPLVGMNVPYDLTILDRNCRRHGVKPLADRMAEFDGVVAPVIDIMVLDKAVDPYRRGSGMRKLEAICPLYRVDPGTAHDSESDALAACRIAWRIGRMYPKLGKLDVWQLHLLQQQWKVEQDTSFAAYLVRNDRDPTGVDGQWPVRRYTPTDEVKDGAAAPELVDVALW